ILNVVAVLVLALLVRPDVVIGAVPSDPMISLANPVRPSRACELFHKWEATRNTTLLNRAAAAAYSPAVSWRRQLPLRTDLTGLRESIGKTHHTHSSARTMYEHAVKADCAAYHHVRRHHHARHLLGHSRPRHASWVAAHEANFKSSR